MYVVLIMQLRLILTSDLEIDIKNCGRFGHIARACPGGTSGNGSFASRPPPPGRSLNTASLPPVKCFRCGGLNHMSR